MGIPFSKFVDVVAKLQGENETQIRTKTKEANQNIKKIEDTLKSFDNSVESVIKYITDKGSIIKLMVDGAVAQMIASVREQSKKEKDKLMNLVSEAKSVLAAGQNLDQRRQGLDKTRQDGTMVQQMKNLKEEINKLRIKPLPEFPNISISPKSVSEDDIRQLIGTHTISTCSPVTEKEEQRHGSLYRCTGCGYETIESEVDTLYSY